MSPLGRISDFSETPKSIPYEKIIIETEKMCKTIETEKEEADPRRRYELEKEVHTLREKVKKLLSTSRHKKIPSNLTKQEREGKKKAYADKERVYLPADKGKVMVAMDKHIEKGGENSYEHKMKKVLEDLKATTSIRANKDWDVTEKVSREGRAIIQEIVEKGEISEQKGRWMKPNDCRAPRLTGYPKIHKNDVPLRGVVSFIGSPYENVAKTLVPILRKLQGRSGHYVKNSIELKEKMKGWTIQRDEILVSYDVEKLYPSIPIQKALDLIENLLKCKPDLQEITTMSVQSIMKLLKWTFKLTYCEYGGNHYTLDCGPIGLSIVGEVAIIYMEEFQMKVKSAEYPELQEWPWYVDDSVLKCKRNRSDVILGHLNEQDAAVRFTKEEEKDNKMSVLDLGCNVNRKRKKIEFNVHYKPTNTNITLKKQSNHRESTKKGVIKGYADRARNLCDPQYVDAELQNIEEVFMANGYERKEVRRAMKERRERPRTEEEKEDETTRGIVSIPNIPSITRTFNRIAKQHNFRTTTKADNKIRDLSSNAKTPLGGKNKHVVYNIPCGCDAASYTGETDRMWESREKEHQDKVRLTEEDIANGNTDRANERMNTGDGGLAKHNSTCDRSINWEGARIVGREKRTVQRKFLEGIETLKEKSKGKTPLNSYNQMEPWQPIIFEYLKTT